MSDRRLGEILSGAFSDILRQAGVVIPQVKLEKVREECNRLAESLERITHNQAVETTRLLQEAVMKGFENFEKEITRLEKEIKQLKKPKKPNTPAAPRASKED